MTWQSKIAILLTLSGVLAGGLTTVVPASAADPDARAKANERDFDTASKEARDLLQRDAAQRRADWAIIATAGAAKWDFKVMNMVGTSFAVPKPGASVPGRLVLLPPLSDIVVPQGQRVTVDITSTSDIHAFVVPALAINKSAVPGRIERIELDTTKSGYFPSACADPCNAEAKSMEFGIHVVDLEVFRHWYANKQAETPQPAQR